MFPTIITKHFILLLKVFSPPEPKGVLQLLLLLIGSYNYIVPHYVKFVKKKTDLAQDPFSNAQAASYSRPIVLRGMGPPAVSEPIQCSVRHDQGYNQPYPQGKAENPRDQPKEQCHSTRNRRGDCQPLGVEAKVGNPRQAQQGHSCDDWMRECCHQERQPQHHEASIPWHRRVKRKRRDNHCNRKGTGNPYTMAHAKIRNDSNNRHGWHNNQPKNKVFHIF